MAETQTVVQKMFARFLNLEVPEDILERLIPLIEKVEKSIREDLDLESVQGQNTLKVLLGTLTAYGWGLGMHPYNNPVVDREDLPLEVRASRDILVPMRDLQSIRYVKKDRHGQIKKVLFEPDQNARVRSQIDNLLTEISLKKWEDDSKWESD
jgi:hypothetical protein